MEDKELDPAQSLKLIQGMISTAKNRLADDGFYIIFWGWLVFVAALTNYFCWILQLEIGFLVWPVLMPLGALVSFIYGRRRNKHPKVKTYVDSYLQYIWISFGIALGLTLLFMPWHGMKNTYFFLMVLYGFATLSSGGLLSFKPLVIGSLFSFVLAAVSVFFPEAEQLLFLSFSLLCSYIIPGHMLKHKYQGQQDV